MLGSNFVDMVLPLLTNNSRAVKAMLALSIDIDVITTKAKCVLFVASGVIWLLLEQHDVQLLLNEGVHPI